MLISTKLIFGILMFALAFSLVNIWGNKRRRDKPLELQGILVRQGRQQVERQLRQQGGLTLEQIANHLARLRVASRPDFLELKVDDPKIFAEFIISYLEQEKRIEKVNLQGKQIFKLVKE